MYMPRIGEVDGLGPAHRSTGGHVLSVTSTHAGHKILRKKNEI